MPPRATKSASRATIIEGHNTVDSGDIINGEVKPADLSKQTAGQAYGRYDDTGGEIPDGQFTHGDQSSTDHLP